MIWKIFSICLVVMLMTMTAPTAIADTFTREDLITEPVPSRFTVCYHGTCEDIAEVNLSTEQWRNIQSVFKDNANPQQERNNIRLAIARLETMVGKITGTYVDKAGTFAHLGEEGQLDCIDESTNTTFYLTMMIHDGLIRWHDLEDRETRGYFLLGWPHTTAVISDRQSGQKYAVDSWFLDNGEAPYILPLEQWDSGWEPS
ncbi:hypothetical protein [Sulfuriflexus mobilis]|uniref:hypothetical protein n=1 Tax=Sulfuriflexus mobilis TaxID=1811807 RepID=UPI000F8352F9|nr:hypothetical protein [Sulfuriflexus mobilis]